MQILFFLLIALKVFHSFSNMWLTLKVIKPENSALSVFNDKQLRRRIVYHRSTMFLEIIFAGALVIGLFIPSEHGAKYIYIGLLIMCIAYVIDDFVAILSHRREQRRR